MKGTEREKKRRQTEGRKRLSETPNRGATLIEILVAVLLSAVMVASVFSVALTAKGESAITEERNAANQAVRQLSAQLHLYVTSYYSYSSGFLPPPQMPEIPGPSCPTCSLMSGNASQWTWGAVTMPGWTSGVSDSCGGNCSQYNGCSSGGGGGGCYVLDAGSSGAECHYLRNYLPPWFEAPPYCARASYTVAAPVSSEGPQVNIVVNWQTP